MPFVLQEHEVLHQELNNQNKALLERVRELVDAGDVKDTRIRELEAQEEAQRVKDRAGSKTAIAREVIVEIPGPKPNPVRLTNISPFPPH